MLNILEGVRAKAEVGAKFVIKSKGLKENRTEEAEVMWASDHDAEQFLCYMVGRSKRFREVVQEKGIENEEHFVSKHLYPSICLKTILKIILDKMLNERRLGKNLKGMNKSNLLEIENAIWPTLEREILIYQNDIEYNRQKSLFKEVLAERKIQIQQELIKLQSNSCS